MILRRFFVDVGLYVILNSFEDLLLFQQGQEHGNRDEILKRVQNDDFLFKGGLS